MISARCIGQAGHYGWRVMVCIKDAKRRTSQIMHLVGTCWSSYAGVGCCNTVSTIFLWWKDRMPLECLPFGSVCSFPSYRRQHEICSRRPVRMLQLVTVFFLTQNWRGGGVSENHPLFVWNPPEITPLMNQGSSLQGSVLLVGQVCEPAAVSFFWGERGALPLPQVPGMAGMAWQLGLLGASAFWCQTYH